MKEKRNVCERIEEKKTAEDCLNTLNLKSPSELRSNWILHVTLTVDHLNTLNLKSPSDLRSNWILHVRAVMRSSFLASTMRLCREITARDAHADLYTTSLEARHYAEACEMQAVADDRFNSDENFNFHPL
ncbi:hypothetical protein PoB_002860600 [Plakobranchus ocellatus]|uniref:Uncharacterized protein n=1 Tax=Plakobranchus ocellatus TaxID=259542 RepID=A0AAV4A630_9GAST|nr:hypothetical protein PoB_002860600 [Plakobranchus ocellatus]